MANTPKNRKDLKSYFVKNSIPTQSNFEDLIDGMLNQQDDGLIKVPGDPLKIVANDSQGLINFFEKIEDANPAWFLQLNPRTDSKDSSTAKAGFCIADGQGMPRLFIDKATGNIGVGTLTPIAHLDIAQAARSGTHSTTINGLYITGDFDEASGALELRSSDGSKGLGFGTNTIYAAGSNDNQDIALATKGNGVLHLTGIAYISPDNELEGIRSTMNNGSLSIGSIHNSYGVEPTQDNVKNRAGLLLSTQSSTEIAVNHHNVRLTSLMYYDGSTQKITIGRNMGWGETPVNIAGNLVVNGSITNANLDSQWQTPVLLNGWVNFDSGYNLAQYRIDGDGVVWLRGLVKDGTFGTNIFNLPTGFRPSHRQLHVVCTWSNNPPAGIGRVDVASDGFVSFQYGSSNLVENDGTQSGWISLDGIAFRASP